MPDFMLYPLYVMVAVGCVHLIADVFGCTFRIEFKWCDAWVGGYLDRKARTLYICPIPFVVLVFVQQFRPVVAYKDARRLGVGRLKAAWIATNLEPQSERHEQD